MRPRAPPGARSRALAPHGLAIFSGGARASTGGIGWKVRRYGLALDTVVGAKVVTAGGQAVQASEEDVAGICPTQTCERLAAVHRR